LPVNHQIHLTELRPSDKSAFVTHLNDDDIYKGTLRIPAPYTEADAESFLEFDAQATEQHGHPVHFAIRNSENVVLGCCGFDEINYGHRAEIGYWLAKPYWGQGIMTEVVRATCEFAMTDWKLVRISAHVFDFNRASARVLEKNGFEYEGFLQKHHRKAGQFVDSKLFAKVK
ncbi:MAG: GNAT family N-acetyltransferase, partial [Planctomycetaceae bacterium]|nr:GNAT family N-acetyltransferase [Planctomycetaceae bacterium]